MSNYFIYLRKSRKDIELESELGDTLARHRKALLDLAGKMHLNITAVYEEVVSGESIASRPQIQQMLSDIESDGCDGVLVMEIERLARGDTVDQGIISRTFSITKTKIITPNKIYDPDNEFDQEYFEFNLFMSRREYKTILRRIQQGRLTSVNEGKFIGSTAPYGYEKVKIDNGKGYTLKPLHPECDAIALIYNLYLNGKDGESFGSYKIARHMDSLGYRSRNGSAWSAASIRDILKNITYAGYIRWGYRKMESTIKNGAVCKKQSSTPSQNPIIIKGLHEPLISKEMFDKVQKKLTNNVYLSIPDNKELKNPLAGIVTCGKCGRVMARLGKHSRNKYDTLYCPNRNCDNISSPIILVEDEILLFFENWIKEQSFNLPDHEAGVFDKTISLYTQEKYMLSEKLRTVSSKLDKTYDLLERGLYSDDEFKQRHGKLTLQKSDIETKICDTDKMICKLEEKRRNIYEYIPKITGLVEAYKSTSNIYDKNNILKELTESAVYIKERPNTRGKLLHKGFSINIIPKSL